MAVAATVLSACDCNTRSFSFDFTEEVFVEQLGFGCRDYCASAIISEESGLRELDIYSCTMTEPNPGVDTTATDTGTSTGRDRPPLFLVECSGRAAHACR